MKKWLTALMARLCQKHIMKKIHRFNDSNAITSVRETQFRKKII